jgi:hypothetical protein
VFEYRVLTRWQPLTESELNPSGDWELVGVASVPSGSINGEPTTRYVYYFKRRLSGTGEQQQ